MGDIALIWGTTTADFTVGSDDVTGDDGLETAIMLSLFTDRRAEAGDVLPDGETDRRGYWGDEFGDVEGDRFGSRLWLLARAKAGQESLRDAQEYATEALQWLLDDKVTDRLEVTTEFVTREVMGIAVTLYRPKADPVEYRFHYTWAAQEAQRA